jgi:hypothetical protein
MFHIPSLGAPGQPHCKGAGGGKWTGVPEWRRTAHLRSCLAGNEPGQSRARAVFGTASPDRPARRGRCPSLRASHLPWGSHSEGRWAHADFGEESMAFPPGFWHMPGNGFRPELSEADLGVPSAVLSSSYQSSSQRIAIGSTPATISHCSSIASTFSMRDELPAPCRGSAHEIGEPAWNGRVACVPRIRRTASFHVAVPRRSYPS